MTKNFIKAGLTALGLTSGTNDLANSEKVTTVGANNLASPARSLLQENNNTTSYDYDELNTTSPESNTTFPEINSTTYNQTNTTLSSDDYDFFVSDCGKLFESLDIDKETKDLYYNATKGRFMTFTNADSHEDIDFFNEQMTYISDYLFKPEGNLVKAVEAMCKLFTGVNPDNNVHPAKNLTKMTPQNAEIELTTLRGIVEKASEEVNVTNVTKLFRDYVENCIANGTFQNDTYSPTPSPTGTPSQTPTGPTPKPSTHAPTNPTLKPTTVKPTADLAANEEEQSDPAKAIIPVVVIISLFALSYCVKKMITSSRSISASVAPNDQGGAVAMPERKVPSASVKPYQVQPVNDEERQSRGSQGV